MHQYRGHANKTASAPPETDATITTATPAATTYTANPAIQEAQYRTAPPASYSARTLPTRFSADPGPACRHTQHYRYGGEAPQRARR